MLDFVGCKVFSDESPNNSNGVGGRDPLVTRSPAASIWVRQDKWRTEEISSSPMGLWRDIKADDLICVGKGPFFDLGCFACWGSPKTVIGGVSLSTKAIFPQLTGTLFHPWIWLQAKGPRIWNTFCPHLQLGVRYLFWFWERFSIFSWRFPIADLCLFYQI